MPTSPGLLVTRRPALDNERHLGFHFGPVKFFKVYLQLVSSSMGFESSPCLSLPARERAKGIARFSARRHEIDGYHFDFALQALDNASFLALLALRELPSPDRPPTSRPPLRPPPAGRPQTRDPRH